MSARNSGRGTVSGSGSRRLLSRTLALTLTVTLMSGCSWFTDFKEQPKIDPWDTPDTNTAPRGNPQGSVPMNGTAAPEFIYARNFQGLGQMAALTNPVPASQESIDRGRKAYQINCSACHGAGGAAGQSATMMKFGIYAPALVGPAANAATTLSDGYIFGIIRNGRGLMPTYNRIEESTRWDIVNYVRALQGKNGMAADTTHGRPGETGQYLVGATVTAPTRSAPYFNSMRAARDTTKPPVTTPTPTPAAPKPPTPEAHK